MGVRTWDDLTFPGYGKNGDGHLYASNEMKRDAPAVTLAPNVDGERVDSWSDAQKLAKSKGKNADSYNALVQKEQAK